MELGNLNASAPASPFDDAAMPPVQQSPSPSQPHSPPSVGSAAGMPAAPRPAVKAPWDDDDEDWGAPAAANPTSPPKAPAPAPQQPAVAATAATGSVSSPAEPHASPASAAAPQPGLDDFIAASPTAELPNRPPTPPENPSATNAAKMDALNKQIASRTVAASAATKEKEAKIVAAAQEYLKALKAKREKEVTAAKANHKQQQQAGTQKIDEYKKSGAVWNAVGMLVDLQKPNQYSKSTEQMRSVLTTLNAAPVKN